jgi:hypothetical protein
MRGYIPVSLSVHERGQLIDWANSEPPGSMLARDSRVILGLDDLKSIIEVAEEQGICRQTVTEIRNKLLILRLYGIGESVPQLGRKRKISGEKANEVLYVPLYEPLGYNVYWSVPDLAKRCDLPYSEVHRFLKERGVSLNNPATIYNVINDFDAQIHEIAGLFLSPSVCLMAFCCEARKEPAVASSPTRVTTYPIENTTILFSKMSEQFFEPTEELKM